MRTRCATGLRHSPVGAREATARHLAARRCRAAIGARQPAGPRRLVERVVVVASEAAPTAAGRRGVDDPAPAPAARCRPSARGRARLPRGTRRHVGPRRRGSLLVERAGRGGRRSPRPPRPRSPTASAQLPVQRPARRRPSPSARRPRRLGGALDLHPQDQTQPSRAMSATTCRSSAVRHARRRARRAARRSRATGIAEGGGDAAGGQRRAAPAARPAPPGARRSRADAQADVTTRAARAAATGRPRRPTPRPGADAARPARLARRPDAAALGAHAESVAADRAASAPAYSAPSGRRGTPTSPGGRAGRRRQHPHRGAEAVDGPGLEGLVVPTHQHGHDEHGPHAGR